ncbi:hypothetical protein [Saccharopolyspora phatthalungensis]|uniref:Uncharacterized protein n=1 Tax=Saccharopolyspora phatthalungensis TaxID=664693 RepID=A0A840QGP5_9PSEU|nr:hypothetical protein [Saccharopolyspora phatthalungensis]MBB5157928.1 hypothetical protein [Saccharopolyspora phatthalungensis]
MITKELRRITLGVASALLLSSGVALAHTAAPAAPEPPLRCEDHVSSHRPGDLR